MTCRFVILKEIDGEPGVFIEYDEKILAKRIKARMKEYFLREEDFIEIADEWDKIEPALAAFDEAFKVIMTEFHDNSSK